MERIRRWEPDGQEEEERVATPTAPRPEDLSPASLLALQRAIGNHAVGGMLMRGRTPPRGRRKQDRPYRKAKTKNPYSGIKHYKSSRLRKLHGSGQGGGPQVPVVTDDGERLWDGRRPGFRASTYTNVLANKGHPRTVNHHGTPREEYQCASCRQWFPRLRDADPDEPTIDLDHGQDWDTYVTMNVDMTEFLGPDGHQWRAYLLDEVVEAYNDEDNLTPMCSHHNRSKGGPKFIDRFQRPEHVGDCARCRGDEDLPDREDEDDDDEDGGGIDDGGGASGAAVTAY